MACFSLIVCTAPATSRFAVNARHAEHTGGKLKRFAVTNILFFSIIGYVGDCLNFTAVQSEIFLANGIFQATELQLGLLGSLTSLGYMLPAFAAGTLSERAGRRPLVLFAVLGITLCYLIVPHVTALWQLYTVCSARSMFSAFLWPPLMAWMANAESHDRLNGLLGKYNVSWAMGILSGFYLAGITFTRFGWQSGFHLSAALGVLLFLFILLCEPHGGTGAPAEPNTEAEHGLHSHEVAYYVRQGMLMLTAGQFLGSLVLYMFPKIVGDEVHEAGQSLLNVAKMAGQVAAFLVFGHTVRWHYRRWPLLLCAGSMGLGVLLVAIGQKFAVYACGSALVGWGFGIAFTMSAFYALGLSESKGQASGMMETLIGGSSVVGPLYGGVIGKWWNARGGVLAGLLPLALTFSLSIIKGANIRRLSAKQNAGS